MPKTRTRNATCGTKLRYDTRGDATAARTRLITQAGAATASLGAYKCRHCPGYHVGHRRMDPNEGRGRR